MAGNDSWIYQGRQHHMWFGHGTKPPDEKPSPATKDGLPSLQERIHSLAYTLIAGLPASKRYHAVGRLRGADHERLDRVMAGVIRALPLGPRIVPIRVLGARADDLGIASFVKAGAVLRDAQGNADLREATDLVALSAQQMGLDRFQPFLREADDHLAQTGGMVALLRDVPAPAAPPVERPPLERPPAVAPDAPQLPPPGQLGPLLRRVLRGALVGVAAGLLDAYTSGAFEQQLRSVFERFKLDPSNPADAAAALAFLWAQNKGPWLFDTPQTGPEMQAMAERVMRAVRADPTLLGRALGGDPAAMAALKGTAAGTTVPGSGIETRTDEERALVARMIGEGRSGAAIQAALDGLRGKGAPGQDRTAGDGRPPVQQIPPEQLRFSQRTAGGNGRAEEQRQYVKENGRIIAPVDAVRTPDGIVTIDNTRVAVAREHGLKAVPVRVWSQSDPVPMEMRRRFGGAQTWGEALIYRTSTQWPPLPPTGTTVVPRLPGRLGSR